ncbi:prepilin-type N-terminal cleavage/methylation domain-containing protein [Sulfurovum sp.]|uniref:prepilin-type N-terminal cleavage/methylation domain-containing protein n=1 Tax=Sulfurovum sp. TaxID=1969726 RepID=UPI0025D1EAB3|nr:prepilin-type N-terminal cleavage/methylation domain-containing protein [Sulfurovum sp.]
MHKGFSLLELLIVILIVSVIYFLGFSGIERPESKPKALTPLNLKSVIMKSKGFHGEATLMCVDKCRSCYLRSGVQNAFAPYENGIDLKDIEAYTLDERESLLRLEYGRYRDKKICLVLDFYQNGSSTQIILKDDEGVYFLPSFFGEAQKADSLEDAKELWLKNSDLVSNSGDFY